MDGYNSSDSEFIYKLRKIVEANLADEEFGVKELARKTRISRTQLHRRIKSINNQSVSQFIREIRLNKAKEMLIQGLGTVSEIAYKVGFSSPSYFIKCFHEYFEYSPGVLLKFPIDGVEDHNRKIDPNNHLLLSESGKKGNKYIVKILAGIVVVVSLVTVAFFLYKNVTVGNESIIQDKSIAVLPLKNLSDNTEIQYLADGIMEDILNRLSQVQELKVRSRISSEQFRNPEISLPDIAKDMKVSYVLEGSILNNNNKVRI